MAAYLVKNSNGQLFLRTRGAPGLADGDYIITGCYQYDGKCWIDFFIGTDTYSGRSVNGKYNAGVPPCPCDGGGIRRQNTTTDISFRTDLTQMTPNVPPNSQTGINQTPKMSNEFTYTNKFKK